MTLLIMLSVRVLHMSMILLTTLGEIRLFFVTVKLDLPSELESDHRDNLECGRKWLVDFKAVKSQLVSFG